MKTRKVLTIALLINLGCSLAMAQGGVSLTNTSFSKAAFDQSLKGAVAPNVMGYQYVLIKDGKIVTEDAGGKARNKADGDKAMTPTTPINIGSLMKFITGTTLLNIMEHPAKWTPSANASLNSRLDYHIWGLFPAVWYNTMDQGVRGISLRELLQHRSGFDDGFKGDRTVMGYIKSGYLESQHGAREYANINFVMTGYLLPLYENEHFVGDVNTIVQNNHLSKADGDTVIRKHLGNRMDQIFHERIWNKMTPRFDPSCNAAVEYKDTAAKGYNSKDDTGAGVLTSQIIKKGHCTGEGGYYMSARDYANYIAHFSASNLIVSKEARDLMYKEGMNPNDRLVWAGATDKEWKHYDWFEKNFQRGVIVWSAGGTDGTNGVLLRLPQNYYLVLLVNSNDYKVNELFNFGAEAFMAATKANFQ